MQIFAQEHNFPLSPVDLIALTDNLNFRDYLLGHLDTIQRSDRIVFEETPSMRRKTIRVYPNLHLPNWIERALQNREPHFDMHYLLDKARLTEQVWGESLIGKMEGEIIYRGAGQGSTVRKFQGQFHCDVRLVGRAIEKFYLGRMETMYEREAELTRRYIRERITRSAA